MCVMLRYHIDIMCSLWHAEKNYYRKHIDPQCPCFQLLVSVPLAFNHRLVQSTSYMLSQLLLAFFSAIKLE